MSTRAQVRFATREDGVSFSEHPEKIHAQFYKHSDGYPEGLGVEIAKSYADQEIISGWEIEDLDTRHDNLDYIYYIWQTPGPEKKDTWISIFHMIPAYCETCGQDVPLESKDECIFVGKPNKLIGKYDKQ
jgi:hypothetical protein